jgi:hypothetical protein
MSPAAPILAAHRVNKPGKTANLSCTLHSRILFCLRADRLQMASLFRLWNKHGDVCPLPESSWISWYWDSRQRVLNQLQPLEEATGASGVEVGMLLSVILLLAALGTSWWWWRRRVKAGEKDILALTRRPVVRSTGRNMQMQSAPLEVFRSACLRVSIHPTLCCSDAQGEYVIHSM